MPPLDYDNTFVIISQVFFIPVYLTLNKKLEDEQRDIHKHPHNSLLLKDHFNSVSRQRGGSFPPRCLFIHSCVNILCGDRHSCWHHSKTKGAYVSAAASGSIELNVFHTNAFTYPIFLFCAGTLNPKAYSPLTVKFTLTLSIFINTPSSS